MKFRTIASILLLACSSFADFRVDATADVTNGLVAWWKLDEMSYNGTTGEVIDSSGNNLNGTAYAVVSNPGKIGRGAYMNGSTGIIEYGNSSLLNNTLSGDFTVSLWYNSKNINANQLLFGRREKGGARCIAMSIWNSDKLCFGEENKQVINITATIDINKWTHIIWTHENGDHKVFTNGILASFVHQTFISSSSSISYRCGDFSPSWGPDFINGSVDDVRIYNRALSSNEVASIYKLALPKKEVVAYSFKNTPYEMLPTNGLVAHWKLDEMSYNGTAGEVKDSSGHGYDGTAVGVISNPGKFGRSGHFDGYDDNITQYAVKLTSTNTICAFVRNLHPGTGFVGFGFISGAWPSYQFAGNGRFVHRSNDGLGGDVELNITDNNDWNLLTATCDGNLVHVYKNDMFMGSLQYYPEIEPNVALSIGNLFDWGPSWASTMDIDDVRIYNRALSSNEVVQIYKAEALSKSMSAAYIGDKLVSNPQRKNYPVSTLPTARDYVQDGLMVNFDSIENAGYGVHKPTAMTWKDLSGHIGSIPLQNFDTSTCWTTNGLYFDGIDDFLTVYDFQPSWMFNDGFTCEVNTYFHQRDNYRGLFGGHVDGFVGLQWENDSLGQVYWYSTRLSVVPFASADIPDAFNHFDITYNPATKTSIATLNYNPSKIATTVHDTINPPNAPFWIGKAYLYGPRYFNGKLLYLRLYNRLLTPSEIEHNRVIDNIRFKQEK